MSYIYSMDWLDGVSLINKAFEKRNEQKEWDMWVSIYPNMDKKTFIPFDKFRGKKQNNKVKIKKNISNDEILAKAEQARLIHQGKHKGIVKK